MIKTVEFTYDIEKPHLSPPNKNSLKRSKTQNQYGTHSSSDNDGPDLIRRRLSSDDEEYQIRMQNAEAFMAERGKYYAENHNLDEAKRRHTRSIKIDHQHQIKQNEINHYRRPIPPNRNVNHLRRPIPIKKHSYNEKEEEGRPIKFRPQPPGSPKSPVVSSTPVINNKQAKNDIQDDSYSYTSYCESLESDSSSSSENNLNLNHSLNNDTKANENSDELNSNADQKSIDNSNAETETAAASIPKSIKEKYFYRMEKSTVSRLPKKKKKFMFYLGNKVLVEATYVKKQKNIQFLAYDSNKQSERAYTLLIGNQKSSFSLRNGTIYDNEIFSMRIVDEKKPFHYFSVFLNSFVNIKDFPNKLINQPPTCDLELPESPNIIFGQRGNTIIPSKSNWIFCSRENEELIAVMKGSKSTVFIESIPSVITPILFTIALVAFIGNPNKI